QPVWAYSGAALFTWALVVIRTPFPPSTLGLRGATWQAEEPVSTLFWRVLSRSWVDPDSEPNSNDHGEFAWAIAYRLEATARYLSIARSDSAAWQLLRKDVRATFACRDDARHLRDYLGRSRPVWSATAYSY